jgi:HSP20 family protein
MTLVKRMQDDLDLSRWFGRRFPDWPETWSDLFETASLKVEEYEDDGHHVIRAEMPGIDPDEDVEITVSDHVLHLRAQRRSEEVTEHKRGYRSEFRYGAFERSIRLPVGATDKDVTATYNDGILEVRVPIDTETAEARKIPVTRS